MANKNNGVWTNRNKVQRAFGKDPQHAYNVVSKHVTAQIAAAIEAEIVPQISDAEKVERLLRAKVQLEEVDMNTADIDAEIARLERGA